MTLPNFSITVTPLVRLMLLLKKYHVKDSYHGFLIDGDLTVQLKSSLMTEANWYDAHTFGH
jgi:hypothetical protein